MKEVIPNRDNKELLTRLSRREGQIRGIKKMIEDNKSCEDVIVQLSSASAALQSTAKVMLLHHMDTCVLESVQNGDAEIALDKLKVVIEKFSKIKWLVNCERSTLNIYIMNV